IILRAASSNCFSLPALVLSLAMTVIDIEFSLRLIGSGGNADSLPRRTPDLTCALIAIASVFQGSQQADASFIAARVTLTEMPSALRRDWRNSDVWLRTHG